MFKNIGVYCSPIQLKLHYVKRLMAIVRFSHANLIINSNKRKIADSTANVTGKTSQLLQTYC